MQLNYIPECLKGSAKKSDIIFDFGTLSTYKQYMIENKDFKDAGHLESMGKGHWSGVYSYDDFIELLDNGDEKVMRQIKTSTQKAIKEFSKKYREKLTNYRFDVVGEFFDVGIVLSGVPEAWLEPELEKEEIPQIELIIDGTFPDGTDLDIIIQNVGRVLGMVKILEDHGVEVKIRQILALKNFTYNSNKRLFVMVDVKDYDEPLNYKKCSALMSPTFLRRGGMKLMEITARKRLKDNYGRKLNVKNAVDLLETNQINNLEKRLFR